MLTSNILLRNADKFPNEPALSIKDSNNNWQTDSWDDLKKHVFKISKSLIHLGINPNDKISIYSYNRKEWSYIYAATQIIRSVSVGVYHTCSPEEVNWIVSNSCSKIVFVGHNPSDNGENDRMPINRILPVLDSLKGVEKVVLMEDLEKVSHEKIITWNEFISLGEGVDESDVQSRLKVLKSEDTSALIYTSGTTGNPKGVELTHGNWEFQLEALNDILKFDQGEKYVSWLPLAHVFGQLVDNHIWIKDALHLHIVDNPLNIVDYAKEVKPHLFIGVPRIYEKIYSNLKSAIDSKSILKIGLKIPGLSNIFKKKLKEAVGLDNIRYAATGAAPINPDILRFFHSLDIPLFEGYGMTENSAVATSNHHKYNKIGTVGIPQEGTEVKILNDGEILIKGKHVMKGYFNNIEATNQDLRDGWLHTGDIGKIDSDGFLSITGRKKEIYVSSGGKNIAPLVIEETMKSITIVSQCFLVGDGRKYCSALLTLDLGVILRDKVGIEVHRIPKDPMAQMSLLREKGAKIEDYTNNKDIFKDIEKLVIKLNGKFSNPEQIKKFSILPRDFTIDDGELTPTLKIRRKQIADNWSSVIESMYTE
ncbi:MAG: AMP-dependent synthetase/ligase [Fidelibacterota bacterium]|jgi:long-chain acyl-CoA synthetase|tara:strand:+ start:470 stop:2245 length:1776 start_codon:yes stop_codon:yes gene_type:complete